MWRGGPLTGSMTRDAVCWHCMGGEPLLRPEFIHKIVYYAAKKGFWVYIATNGRLLKPGLPKARVPAQKNLEHILRKQYVYEYLVFFNINICGNNREDVKMLTEYAHEHRVATDYHLNETPMLEQDEHFKHLNENPTYIRPEDWRSIDELIDWIIAKNKAGYQMVNSVPRLEEMKSFIRMSSGLDIRKVGWYGDGNASDEVTSKMLSSAPGIVQDANGELSF